MRRAAASIESHDEGVGEKETYGGRGHVIGVANFARTCHLVEHEPVALILIKEEPLGLHLDLMSTSSSPQGAHLALLRVDDLEVEALLRGEAGRALYIVITLSSSLPHAYVRLLLILHERYFAVQITLLAVAVVRTQHVHQPRGRPCQLLAALVHDYSHAVRTHIPYAPLLLVVRRGGGRISRFVRLLVALMVARLLMSIT